MDRATVKIFQVVHKKEDGWGFIKVFPVRCSAEKSLNQFNYKANHHDPTLWFGTANVSKTQSRDLMSGGEMRLLRRE